MTYNVVILCFMYFILRMLCTSFDTFQEMRKAIALRTGGEVFDLAEGHEITHGM